MESKKEKSDLEISTLLTDLAGWLGTSGTYIGDVKMVGYEYGGLIFGK